jgi:DNA-binding beta-propeller fold protein YncE
MKGGATVPTGSGRAIRAAKLGALQCLLWLTGCQTAEFEHQAAFYPPPPDEPRVQFLTTITSEEDLGVERDAFREFVTGKKQDIKVIGRPWDIDHEPGRIYVVDKELREIVIVDLVNKRFEFVDTSVGGPLRNPGGIFIAANGYKYVADRDRRQILVYNRSDGFSRTYDAGPDFQPTDVVVDGDRVYACDIAAEEIKVFDRASGEVAQVIDQSGKEGGAFRLPTHLALDDAGSLYVTDFLHFRVQMFDRQGNFVRTIGEPGDFPGAMPRPKGIAVDRDRHLLAVDSAFELVQIFDIESGDVLLGFGKFGSLNGGTWLPSGVDVDYDNVEYFSQYVDSRFQPEYLIYVANQAGPFRINVYAFGRWIGETLPGTRASRD